jgi:hypothetical protein
LTGTVEDPFLIARTEIIRPDANNLRAVVLTAITSPGTQKTAPLTVAIDVQLTDGAGSPVTFRQFVLNLNVVVRAYAATNPDQPPERIANFTRQIQFSGAAVAALQITPGDLTSFRPADHEPELEFIITAAAYPGLQGVTVKADVS